MKEANKRGSSTKKTRETKDEKKGIESNLAASEGIFKRAQATFKSSEDLYITDYLTKDVSFVAKPNYLSAIDYISAQSSKLNTVANQLTYFNSPVYQPSLLTAVTGLQNQLSAFSSVQAYLPKIDHLSAVSPLLSLSRSATLAYSGLTAPKVLNSLTASVANNIQPWYDANIGKPSLVYNAVSAIPAVSNINKNFADLFVSNSLSALTIQSGLVKATEYSVLAEKSLFAVTPQNIGSRIALTGDSKNFLTSSFVGLSDSYSTLLRSFKNDPLTYTQISPSVSRIAPIEYFTSANLLETISVDADTSPEHELLKNEIQYENEILLSTHLPRIDPALYRMWKGAIEAYNSNNSDKVRHFFTSMRELYTHLMHILAPNKEVKKWTTDPDHIHNGNPTRKARLLFICRNINNDPFNAFVNKEVDSTLAFIDIFQKGTHGLNPDFSTNQLLTVKSKAESTLKFLLEIHFTTNN